jgi:hypothetical protein
VTGRTESSDFPTTPGAWQTTLGGGADVFVTKLNPTGSALVYSTYLGGARFDQGSAIAVDAAGNAYVTGGTTSGDFPTTPGTRQPTFGGGFAKDVFVTKLNPTGRALAYSTYLGAGSDEHGYGIAVDSVGNAYVTGTSATDFPTTPGALQTTSPGGGNGFIAKLNPAASALVYSTYLGGSSYDQGAEIAVDAAGSAHVTGYTESTDFPTTPDARQTALLGFNDAYLTKLNPAGGALVYSTYLGGSGGDEGIGVALDSAGNAYTAGFTTSSDFPTTPGTRQATFGGGFADAFVTKLAFQPTSKDECRNGGYKQFGFKNEGQCVAFVQRGSKP